jgi:protocatechuate 3,4-dioxygenase beta subunit
VGNEERDRSVSRRSLVRLGLAAPVLLPAAACSTGAPGGTRGAARTALPSAPVTPLPTTPACGDAHEVTVAQTEGPYFTPGSPERAALRTSGMAGAALTLTGFVVDRDCRPIGRALLDFWQADAGGEYDNEGFTLRGHQFSAADGGFRLETVMPGKYATRTRHIHVKAQAPGGPVLTTQLYFPGEPANRSDGIFDRALVIELADAGRGNRRGQFTFVLATA